MRALLRLQQPTRGAKRELLKTQKCALMSAGSPEGGSGFSSALARQPGRPKSGSGKNLWHAAPT